MPRKLSSVRTTIASATVRATSPRRKAKISREIAGSRVGTKARDMRWKAPDGVVWASRFEYEVYSTLKEKCVGLSPTTDSDSMAYRSTVKSGICTDCGSANVAQQRTYTPDMLVTPKSGGKLYYIEAKGYLRSERRSLLRAFRQGRPEIDLRLVVQRDHKITKTMTIVEWANRYLKVPIHVWDGDIPESWK